MLMALLYTTENKIAAAAPACDHAPYGDRYWNEFHEADLTADLTADEIFETAYVTIANQELQARLLMLGIDETADGVRLAAEVSQRIVPYYTSGKAA